MMMIDDDDDDDLGMWASRTGVRVNEQPGGQVHAGLIQNKPAAGLDRLLLQLVAATWQWRWTELSYYDYYYRSSLYWLMIMQLQTQVAQATHLVSHLPVLDQLVKSVKAPQTKGGHLVSVDRAVLLRVVIPAPAQDHACLGRVLIKQAWWPQISAALCWPMLPPVFRPKSSPLQCVGQ